MFINATTKSGHNLRSVRDLQPDLTLSRKPRRIAAMLLDRQFDHDKESVCDVASVWLECINGDTAEVDAEAVRTAAAEMMAESDEE